MAVAERPSAAFWTLYGRITSEFTACLTAGFKQRVRLRLMGGNRRGGRLLGWSICEGWRRYKGLISAELRSRMPAWFICTD
jgi:hypothetical protein